MPNDINSVDNNIPQSNKNGKPNILSTKYSMQENGKDTKYNISETANKKWQDFLENNYKSTGTKTNMQEKKISNENTEEYYDLKKYNTFSMVYEDFYTKNGLDLSQLDIDAEVVNDILARQLGNQEYITKLAIEQPNIFIKIYNWIKNVLLDGNNTNLSYSERSQLNKLQNMFEEVYRTTYNQSTSNSHYSISKTIGGEDIVISDDKLGSRPTNKAVKKLMEEMIGLKYLNTSSNKSLQIDDISIGKYLHDGYKNPKGTYLKKRVSGNFGEILEISKIDELKSNKANYKGSSKGKLGFDYYNVNLAYPIKKANGEVTGYNTYTARLIVRKEKDGNYAYDLDKITKKEGLAVDKTSLSILTTNNVVNDDSFNEDNIPQSNKNGKPNILSTKYSMQENGKDTKYNISETTNKKWQDFLENNYKSTGTKTNMQEIKVSNESNKKAGLLPKAKPIETKEQVSNNTKYLIIH